MRILHGQRRVRENPPAYGGRCRCILVRRIQATGRVRPKSALSIRVLFEMQGMSRGYMRRRLAELRAGTWKPTGMRRNVPNATRIPTEVDIAWVAGFLEREGHFRRSSTSRDRYGTEHVSAGQVDPEPLCKLQEFFGGGIHKKKRRTWGLNDILYWTVSGERPGSR